MKVFIMRGLPGSGKTSWWKKHYPNARVFSADLHHIDTDGIYRFKADKAKYAHDKELARFMDWMLEARFSEPEPTIVDNTNTTAWEIAPYYRIAEVCNHYPEIIHLVCSVTTGLQRGTHNVPEQTMLRMRENIAESRLPSWWKETRIETEPNESEYEDGLPKHNSIDPGIWQDDGGES